MMSGIRSGPQQLVPVVREFVADALTPISAYLALATPGRSLLLESVEGTDRIARYSFIGLDYLAATAIDAPADINAELRELLAKYSPLDSPLEGPPQPFGGGAPFEDHAGRGGLDIMGALDALAQTTDPALVLPEAARSWLTVRADYAAADGSTPVTAILELRTNVIELYKLPIEP